VTGLLKEKPPSVGVEIFTKRNAGEGKTSRAIKTGTFSKRKFPKRKRAADRINASGEQSGHKI